MPPVSKASRPRLEPTTRSFLASAEAVFRARRNDPQFDFSGPAIEYAKAVETELNALIFPALRRVLKSRQPNQREVRGPEGRMDLGGRVPHQSLGSVKVLLEREGIVQRGLRQTLNSADAGWLLGELPHQLGPLSELRNPAAHRAVVPREETSRLREGVLGIGHEGLLVRIARARMRAAAG